MGALQVVIDYASTIDIDRRKVVGIQFTRNEVPRTSLTPTYQPWRFSVNVPSNGNYNQTRALVESMDLLDRNTPEVVTFSNRAGMEWIFRYQGAMDGTAISNLTVKSFDGNQLELENLPALGSSVVMFEPNDLIQIDGYPYPFTSTTQVTRGSGTEIIITTHRPNIISGSGYLGQGINVGNDCSFNLFCPNMPTYKLIAGGYERVNGVVVSRARIEFSDDFKLYEWVGGA